jgi:hypothetical protein
MTLATTFHSYAQRSRDFLADEAQVTAAIKTIIRAVLDHDYGTTLQRTCRGLAIVIAFTYAAGYALGAWVHQCNEQLSGFSRQFNEPDWHSRHWRQQRLAALKARLASSRLAVRETGNGDPQPCLLCTDAPQATPVAPVALVAPVTPVAPVPVAPKTRARRKAAATKAPSATDRKRRAKNAECTTAALT